MWRRTNGILGLALSLALLVSMGVPVSAAEPQPHAFYGTVTISTLPAPTGTVVTAVVEGGDGSITTTEVGQYGGPELLDDKLVVKGAIEPGALIEFYIDGAKVDQTANFFPGRVDELNLTVPGPIYELIVASSAGGSVTDPGEGIFPYPDGITVDLLAVPDTGYAFINWTGETGTIDAVTSADTFITMSDNYSITANFAVTYQLTVASSAGGSVTDPGEGIFPYPDGITVDLLAVPDTGYAFINWTGETGTIDDVNSADTSITMSDNYSITANFAVTYQLTVASSDGGNVTTPGEATFTYLAGTVVDLLAVPDTGYAFINWTGDTGTIDDVTSADTFITMNGNYSITANFTPIEYELEVDSSAGGNVTVPGEATFPYPDGTAVDLLAVPDTGYAFINWTGETGTIDDVNSADTSITMSDNYSITANFAVTYQLTVASSDGGNVTTPGEGPFTYLAGTEVDLLAAPDTYYALINWTGDTGTIANTNDASTKITMNGDYSITANFVQMVWTLRLCQGWNAISTPIALDPSMDTWEEFGAGLDLDLGAISYYFDGSAQSWKQVPPGYELKPCDAIYVKMASEDTIVIVASQTTSVPAKQLHIGWNLVGLAYLPFVGDSLPGMKATDALASVEEVSGGLTGYAVVVSPPLCQPPWFYTAGEIVDWDGNDPAPDGWMLIGKGYWVFMLNDGMLAGFTFTPL